MGIPENKESWNQTTNTLYEMTQDPHSPSAFAWYWNRLRCMSLAEIVHRIREKLFSSLQRFGMTRLHSIPQADFSVSARAFIGMEAGIASQPYIEAADEILNGRLRIFALDHNSGSTPQWNRDPKTGIFAPLFFAKTLDYRNERLVGDIKYLWELNRHLHLVTLAQAYRLGNDQCYLDGLQRHLESWFNQCPYMKGPNWASSLEIAIRLINWSFAWQLIGGLNSQMFSSEEGIRFRDRWLRAIYQHMHFISGHFSRFSSANNHLIGEAAGLFIGAVSWPFWRQSQAWNTEAKNILEREIHLQNAPDGVNREQTTSYQQFILDFLLISALTGKANKLDFSDTYWKRIEAMLEFLASIMDAGGNVPMIGDADDGYVVRLSQEHNYCHFRSLLATGAVLFGRGDFKAKAGALDDKTRWLLGSRAESDFHASQVNSPILPVRRSFPEGGYYILGCDFETGNEVRLVADAGPLGYLSIAAHGHADALAFTLSVGRREFLIDPGTYAYHTNKVWRDYFRGTSAHNTVVVDGQNQSVIGGNFMWLDKAEAICEQWETGKENDRFVGSHDGYKRLPDPVVHRREILFNKLARRITINDTLSCSRSHHVQLFWHFSEQCDVYVQNGAIVAKNGKQSIKLLMPNQNTKMNLARGEENPPLGWVSRSFDRKKPTTTAVISYQIQESQMIKTEFICS